MVLDSPTISILGRDAKRKHSINAASFQQNAITTINGWQYVAYYLENREGSACLVNLSRRKIQSAGEGGSEKPGEWETLVFEDYSQTEDDGHNTISIGVCRGDETIHVAFDHHCDPLRFRISQLGRGHSWSPSLFTQTQDFLPGILHNELMKEVSYPRFVNADDDLLLSYRIGQAGQGSDVIYRYSFNTHSYTYLGQHLTGISNNPYVNGIDYRNARLYVSWCYRNFVTFPKDAGPNAHKQQAGPNGPENNHDLNYACSDDRGETWMNSDGRVIAAIGARQRSEVRKSISPDADGIKVFEIPMGSGILNQEAQAADWEGGFWVMNREKVDGKERWIVYRRDPEGEWTKKVIRSESQPTEIGARGSICVDREGNVYLILPGNSDSTLTIMRARKDQGYEAFETIWREEGFDGEPLVDVQRLEAAKGVLSIFTRTKGDQGSIAVLDFILSSIPAKGCR